MFGSDIGMSEEAGAGDTAIGYTDDFLAAAVASIDASFGKGFAKDNPALVGNYLIACSNNLNAFMTAGMAMQSGGGGLEALLSAAMEDPDGFAFEAPEPEPKPRGKQKN